MLRYSGPLGKLFEQASCGRRHTLKPDGNRREAVVAGRTAVKQLDEVMAELAALENAKMREANEKRG
jgi:hypothetical protein